MPRSNLPGTRGMAVVAALAVIALGLTGCGGLGAVSPKLVELYDIAAEDGMIELELERDGTILEMEADIPVSALPDVVREAAMKKAPGARITGAEREFNAKGAAWEVKLNHEGRDWEFVIDDEGSILEVEKELRRSEAPQAVLAAAKGAVTGGVFRSVEEIKKYCHDGGEAYETEYHVKKMIAGVSYKIVLDPSGNVKRKVREHKAEIEIPLE